MAPEMGPHLTSVVQADVGLDGNAVPGEMYPLLLKADKVAFENAGVSWARAWVSRCR
jgi:hypothetical protein